MKFLISTATLLITSALCFAGETSYICDDILIKDTDGTVSIMDVEHEIDGIKNILADVYFPAGQVAIKKDGFITVVSERTDGDTACAGSCPSELLMLRINTTLAQDGATEITALITSTYSIFNMESGLTDTLAVTRNVACSISKAG